MTAKRHLNEPLSALALEQTRRQFFRRGAGLSVAPMALASLLDQDGRVFGEEAESVMQTHHRPRAKSVIFLHMIGGPSQIDLFDPKPEVIRRDGDTLPESLQKKLTFAQIQEKQPRLMGSPWKFSQHGECGATVSELMPHIASIVDDVSFVRTVKTDDTNHMFAELMLNTGWRRFGRPSIGSWVVYGLRSESQQLPAFMVLRSGMRPRSKSANYGNGFLPSKYQGTPLRSSGDPILNLASPPGFTEARQRQSVDAINALNRIRYEQTKDDEIAARIVSYELAFRMQSAATEWLDLKSETPGTFKQYGIDDAARPSFARNCLLARRLVERGVRFVQLFHGDWDHHSAIKAGLPSQCGLTDQASAALVRDLAQRGLLDDTLVVWGGELGRGAVAQVSDKPNVAVGRDHQIEAFTMWFAGGGARGGQTIGKTNDFGCLPETEPWHVYDLQATILHLLGLDHTKLTYRYQGRDFRLTDVHGNVKHELFA
ncbi:MAG: sulfatase [Planctomycetaceae bacterium]|nr:sulfatase [Planctomycetaceae bacterium]